MKCKPSDINASIRYDDIQTISFLFMAQDEYTFINILCSFHDKRNGKGTVTVRKIASYWLIVIKNNCGYDSNIYKRKIYLLVIK